MSSEFATWPILPINLPIAMRKAQRCALSSRSADPGNRDSARSAVRPDRQSAVCVAILQEARSLKRKRHALAGLELPVPRHLDIGEMDEAPAWDLRCLDHPPAFIGVERLDHARCPFHPFGRPLRHGPIKPRPAPDASAVPRNGSVPAGAVRCQW